MVLIAENKTADSHPIKTTHLHWFRSSGGTKYNFESALFRKYNPNTSLPLKPVVEPELEVNLGNVSDKIEAMCLNTILILNFLSAKQNPNAGNKSFFDIFPLNSCRVHF